MKKLFAAADACLAELGWKDVAMLKFCLLSLGILLGIAVPKERRRPAIFAALGIFFATYIPLMQKCVPALRRHLCGSEKENAQ